MRVCVSHQSLNEAHLLCFGQGADCVVEEHSEQLWAQPLLTSAATAAACTGRHNGGLCQGHNPE